jgi:transposase-like protein
MEFVPPFCPNTACQRHEQPRAGFFVRHGFYLAACRPAPIPRFRCRSCRRTFSTQTFRQDYRDRRPELNEPLFVRLVSGTGYRQLARTMDASVGALQRKARKMARQAGLLHENLSAHLPTGRTFVLDEEETYEQASIRTVTMPVVVEKDHWFVVATAVGPIRRLAAPGTARRQWQERDERKHGKRPDKSSECVEAVLRALDAKLGGDRFVLRSDLKSSYVTIAQAVFGNRVSHERTSSREPRTTYNPLFVVNTTFAMTRDSCGRLRRKSWLVTKKRACLLLQMHQFTVYRNYIRKRFNHDKEDQSPAVHLKLIPRSLQFAEAIRWRQDWGQGSIHPLCAVGSRRIKDGAVAVA